MTMNGRPQRQAFNILLFFLGIKVTISVLVVATTAVLAVLFFPEIVSQHLWFTILSVVIWGIAASAGFLFFLLRFQPARRMLLPEIPSYGRDLEEFTRSFSLIAGFDELLNNQIRKMAILTGTERVAFLVAGARGEDYTVRASRGYKEEDVRGVAFQTHARLVKWLHTNETYLIPSENPGVMEDLGAEGRALLDRLDVTAIFSLMALNWLVGMVFISKEEALTSDQIEAVLWVTPHISLALANALMYEQQRIRMSSLYRAERLAITGRLAAGAAHEIRNPLASIRSTIQYLRGSLKTDPDASDMMGVLLKETDRIDTIVQGMLSFARPAEPRLERVNLSEVVSQTLKLVEPTAWKSRVEIRTRWPSEGAEVYADPNQLRQVFLNVLLNAVQAMPEGGTLGVCVSRAGAALGALRWQVEIADTGAGIPREHLEKIFDPFFTTRQEGTGLGLSICHAILQGHGGEIDVESAPGQGTCVKIRL